MDVREGSVAAIAPLHLLGNAVAYGLAGKFRVTVEKSVDYNNQTIEIQFGDIDLLEITHTEDQKVSLSMQDYKENPIQVDIKSKDDVIAITSINFTSIEADSKMDKFCYEQPLFPSYKLMLPKGCNIAIIFENGNFSTQNFIGNLNLRLNTGDVTIDDFEGNINAELFSGNIDATIKDTEVAIRSNHGKITTTFPSNDWQTTDISLNGTLGTKKNLLKVQSINANIMLNSSTTQ